MKPYKCYTYYLYLNYLLNICFMLVFLINLTFTLLYPISVCTMSLIEILSSTWVYFFQVFSLPFALKWFKILGIVLKLWYNI